MKDRSCLAWLRDYPQGLHKHAELDKAGPDGKINAGAQQKNDQNVAVQKIADGADDFCEQNKFLTFS